MTLEVYGTDMVLDLVNVKGGLPTRNWQFGSCDYADNLNGPAINEKILTGRKACFACPIACGRLTEVKAGKYACKGEGPEYETVGAFGPMCGVDDLEEPLSDGPAAGLVVDLDPLLDAYYDFRGLDIETVIPTAEKLKELDLEDIIDRMEKV
jgi:aldehyde:ferredoxin oxidoreductase